MATEQGRGYTGRNKNRTRSRTPPSVPYRSGHVEPARIGSRVRSIVNHAAEQKETPLEIALGSIVCTRFCRRSRVCYVSTTTGTTSHTESRAPYIVSTYCWLTYIFVLATNKSSPVSSYKPLPNENSGTRDAGSQSVASSTMTVTMARRVRRRKSKKPLSGMIVVGINFISCYAASAHATTADEWFCTCLEKSHYRLLGAKTTGQTVPTMCPFFLRQTLGMAICSRASLTFGVYH